ncbi:MAG: mechanosensitive ion channel family protein [Pseudomonadota bacterium]
MDIREIVLLASAALLFLALLYRFCRRDRADLLSTCVIGVIGLGMQGLALLAVRGGMDMFAGVLTEAGVVATGIAFIRLTGLFAFRLLLPALRVQAPRILEDVVVVAGYVAWILVRLRYAGVNPGELVAASAVVTAIIAFSMQDTLGNILGGIALQLDDSIDIGDWVKTDDLTGIVIQVGWRSTSLRTRNGEIVVVPNGLLMKNRFLVLGREVHGRPQWRRWVWFDCPNDVPPAQVIGTVRTCLQSAAIADVSNHPAPDCLLMGFSNGVCQYAVRYWLTDLWRDDPTDSEIRQHVIAALRRAGIPLALPQYRLRTVAEGEAFDRAKQQRDHARRTAVLRGAELFTHLTGDEVETLADRLVYAPYAAGDVITRQGDTAHWLYLVSSGEAEVFIENGDGTRRQVNVLSAGSFFGEMALLTGAPRRATVIARSNVECYRLDKQSFADLLLARPAIAEEVSHILAERQHGLENVLQDRDADSRQLHVAQKHHETLAAIKRFFALDR